MKTLRSLARTAAWILSSLLVLVSTSRADDPPHSRDPRVVVEKVAESPDIVHPIGAAFTKNGKLLVVESHTHFRPPGYQGPKADRIRLLVDDNRDGKADRFETFYEGTTATMDLALHPSGSIYLAARNEILRLNDDDGDGKADRKERLISLETLGNYPHNGLSGLAFDFHGDVYFGLGENLGADYTLVGADGTKIKGGGEGGGVFTCSADGKNLQRLATGFWNPFGACFDIFGRLFFVENDPDASPPCRLLHIIEGGDYGYQFRYGRSGRHPFQAWNGELPGTLPMLAGTGESPCKIVSYESDGLPGDYLGNLLVAAWSDHRIERYRLAPKGSSFTSIREPFIEGGVNFRPVGVAVAPDGSLFITDWVLRDYNLHGKGAIWRIRSTEKKPTKRIGAVSDPLASADRVVREAQARKLADSPKGRDELIQRLTSVHVRERRGSPGARRCKIGRARSGENRKHGP